MDGECLTSSKKEPKDGSDEGRYSEKHKKTVLDEMKKDGVILELFTHHKLIENGWDSTLNARFARIERNLPWKERVEEFGKHLSLRDDSILGEIDVVAEKYIKSKRGIFLGSHLKLVIECKTRLDMNWVLYMKKNEFYNDKDSTFAKLSMNESSVFNYLREINGKKYDFWAKKIHYDFSGASHHCNSKLPHIAETGWGLFKNRNSLYDAVRHVLDALDYYILGRSFHSDMGIYRMEKGGKSEFLSHWRIYPVIIFDGSLWGLNYNDGEPDIYPLEYGVFEYVHQNRKYYVDIVQIDALNKYVDIIELEIEDIKKISED